MRIKVLGTRGEVKPSLPYHGRHSGVLVDGQLLLDLGEKEFLKERSKAIFVTHLHPDHAVFVKEPVVTRVPIWAPENWAGKPEIKVISGRVRVGEYKVTPIPTRHSQKVKSVGYVVEKGGQRIFYSGDLIGVKRGFARTLGKLDLVICEASFMRRGGLVRKNKQGRRYGHGGIPNLLDFFKQHTKRVLLVHLGSWFYRDTKKAREKVEKLASEKGIEIEMGFDGMELKLR